MKKKDIKVQYFASFRDQAKKSEETLEVNSHTALDLFDFVSNLYGFKLRPENVRVAINESLSSLNHEIKDGDAIVFLPPVAGG